MNIFFLGTNSFLTVKEQQESRKTFHKIIKYRQRYLTEFLIIIQIHSQTNFHALNKKTTPKSPPIVPFCCCRNSHVPFKRNPMPSICNRVYQCIKHNVSMLSIDSYCCSTSKMESSLRYTVSSPALIPITCCYTIEQKEQQYQILHRNSSQVKIQVNYVWHRMAHGNG